MENSALRIIRTFSSEELDRFHLFLKSPYYNNSKKLIVFYEKLKSFAPEFDNQDLSYELLYESVSPGLTFKAVTVRRLLFDLEKIALLFLKHRNFEKDYVESSENLRAELIARSLERLFEMNIDAVEDILKKNNNIETELFLNKLNLETDKMNLRHTTKKNTNKSSLGEMTKSLVKGNNYLVLFFTMNAVEQFLNLQSFYINYGKAEGYEELKQFIEIYMESIDRKRLKEMLSLEGNNYYPVFEIYYNLFKAFTSEKDDYKYYYELKHLLYTNVENLKQREKHFLFMRLISFCTYKRKGNPKDEKASAELLELYELVLSNKYYKSDSSQYLHPTTFKNIIGFGIKMKKFEWIEDFLNNYSESIHPMFRESMKNFGMARLRFAQRNWSECLFLINRVNPDVFSLKAEIRTYLIMTHFELGNLQTVQSMLEGFRRFSRRSPMIPKVTKEQHKRFAFYVDRLTKLGNSRTRVLYSRLRKMVENDKKMMNKEWIIEKLAQAGYPKINAA